MKTVNTREYVGMLRDLVRQGKSVSLLVSGSSMAPFLIHHRDYVHFRSPERKLKVGDIVFYERDSGQFVMHRIVRVRKSASGSPLFDIAGDNQTVIETGVRSDQIFARIYEVQRKGKTLCPGSFWWEFFARVWPRVIPLRRAIARLYGLVSRSRS